VLLKNYLKLILELPVTAAGTTAAPLTLILMLMSTPVMSSSSSSGPILSIPFLLFRFFRPRAFSIYASGFAVGAIVQLVSRFCRVVQLSRRSLFSRVCLVLIRMPLQSQFLETLFNKIALPFLRQLVEIRRDA
jgi:hypothetical protein